MKTMTAPYLIADPAVLLRPKNARKTIVSLLLCVTLLCVPLAVLHYTNASDDGGGRNLVDSSSLSNMPKEDFIMHRSIREPTAELYRRFMRQLQDASSEELSVVVSFEDILKTIIFLLAAWISALVFRVVGLPALVGEIVCGFLLGPPVLDFCPFPEAMVLIGNFGLIGLILDSGVNLDIAQLKETGSRAVLLAVSGTLLAMSTGFGMGTLSKDTLQSAIAVGAAFAPSSLGVASQVLAAGEVLNTPIGQLIVAASVVDDVLGLIMLSILEVFVLETPEVIDFLLPFISSFGYLIVLGYLGITWIPYILQTYVLPRFAEGKREAASFALMFLLLTAYLPLLNYSGASYLTGAFLAGLSFSQIHFVHVAYTRSTKELMVWLMRIFFAATIGFQVPVRYFGNPEVLKLAAGFLVPVLAKLPLGLCVPYTERPADFPYDPYWRDVSISSLSMLCRGEFNFIVASFALSVGLLNPEHYAAVVLAVLLSCAFAPLALTQVIRYYNNKSKAFFDGHHAISRIGKTMDGDRPLFLAIQARTPVTWGLQGKFTHALEKAGAIIVDHRSWHTLGLDAVDITEIFCQDKEHRVTIKSAFSDESDLKSSVSTDPSKASIAAGGNTNTPKGVPVMDDSQQLEIQQRCDELKKLLIECLGDVDASEYVIQVTQWETFECETVPDGTITTAGAGKGFCFHTQSSFAPQELDEEQPGSEDVSVDQHSPTRRPSSLRNSFRGESGRFARQESNASQRPMRRPSHRVRLNSAASDHNVNSVVEDPHLVAAVDLWETDEVCHNIAREGFFMVPGYDGSAIVTEGCPGEFLPTDVPPERPGHFRHRTFDAALLQSYNLDVETETIRERLHGYVRP